MGENGRGSIRYSFSLVVPVCVCPSCVCVHCTLLTQCSQCCSALSVLATCTMPPITHPICANRLHTNTHTQSLFTRHTWPLLQCDAHISGPPLPHTFDGPTPRIAVSWLVSCCCRNECPLASGALGCMSQQEIMPRIDYQPAWDLSGRSLGRK